MEKIEHLPECPMLDKRYPKHPLEKCDYCDMLRACEQRKDEEATALMYRTAFASYNDGVADGYAAALRDTRDAVAAASLRIPYEDRRHVYLDDALSAIDALNV